MTDALSGLRSISRDLQHLRELLELATIDLIASDARTLHGMIDQLGRIQRRYPQNSHN